MIHNQVNARLGKPLVTTKEVLTNYREVYSRGSFCDPSKCNERIEKQKTQSHRMSPVAIAACAGGSTVAILFLALGVWYGVRRMYQNTSTS